MTTKVCNRCERELPVSEFYRQKLNRDGLFGQCKACVIERSLARYYGAIPPRAPAKDQKASARRKTQYARKAGKLRLGESCQDCGRGFSDERPRQAHHPDYSRPLDVVWLCPACHGHRHAWVGAAFLRSIGRPTQ